MTDSKIGWREWVELPELEVPALKAKIDTGALTSCLHAVDIETATVDGLEIVTFRIQPLRRRPDFYLNCEAPVMERRVVRDSGGHEENRIVIRTRLKVGEVDFDTDFTLTGRDNMIFPMLMGRRALVDANLLVDVNESYFYGRSDKRRYQDLLPPKKKQKHGKT